MRISILRPNIRRLVRRALMPVCVALLAISLTGAKVPTGKPEDSGLSTERLKRIDQVIQRAIEAKQISGAVTLSPAVATSGTLRRTASWTSKLVSPCRRTPSSRSLR